MKNSKSQAPTSREAPSSNLQWPGCVALGIWCLEFLWSSAPGAWIFLLPAPAPAATAADSALGAPPSAFPTVGMEGRLEILLPGALLEAKPLHPRSLIILRI